MKKIVLHSSVRALLFMLFAIQFIPVMAVEPPIMGWSSWNAYGFNISESVIKSQADAMVNLGFQEKGYNHINIDDGFFGGRDENGKLKIHPERFPNGMRTVVDYIHSKGLKAGIYSDAGCNTCASFWGEPKDLIGIGVGLYGHDEQDMELYFNELDFDFIKIDYCGADARNNADGLDLDVEQRYKEIYDAIKKTGRDDITWNICRWAFPGTWACDIANSWRTTEDIYLGWASVKSIIEQSLYLSAYTGNGHYNDMDMLEVGRGLTTEEDKTHFGMWCMMSSPLLIGCDLNDIKGNALSLMQNEELIALNQDVLGLQAYVVKKMNNCYVLVKDIETLYGNKRAVAFYNPTDAETTLSVDFIELDLYGNVKVRDLFEKNDLGVKNESMSVTLPAHATRIYKLEAETRLERTIYEAETAWLTSYQELEEDPNVSGTAVYDTNTACSGGVKAGWLGNAADNDLQWRNVYSNNGGDYTMRIAFMTGEERKMKIAVNDEAPIEVSVNAGSWNVVGTKDVEIKLQKGNNVIRLYNESAYMPDIDYMKLISHDNVIVENYPISVDKSQVITHESRKLNGVSLSGSKDGDQTISLSSQYVYNKIDTPVFTARAGETLWASFNFTTDWMNGYVYLDHGMDGEFSATLGENSAIPDGSDIMAFSLVNGYNSAGNTTSDNVMNPPAFTLPVDLQPGFYRMRFKVDWDCIDPAGRAEDGNGIIRNGGAILDVRMNIHTENCNIGVTAQNGTVTTAEGAELDGIAYPFGKSLAVKVAPAEGYLFDALKIRHGHNLKGDKYIHGVAQYDELVIPAYLFENNRYDIPADVLDGDVEIEAVFVSGVGSATDGEYALSFDKDATTANAGAFATTVNINGVNETIALPATATTVYNYLASTELAVSPGSTINVSVDTDASYHYYLYVDLNNDGCFTTTLNTDGKPAMSSELLSYTYYNGKNSLGADVDATSYDSTLPGFAISTLIPNGIYRARLKADNNNVDPAGSESIVENGGVVVDFLLNIYDNNVNVELYSYNGNIYYANGEALPLSVSALEPLNVKAVPVQGYELKELKVRHGYNLSGPQYVNGNRQWSEFVPESESFTIPADCVSGSLEVYATYKAGVNTEYRLVFSDEFDSADGTQPVSDKWMRCQRMEATWNRWLSDSKEVVYIENGKLVTRAIPNPDTTTDNVPMITGGIKSNGKFGFTYGYVEGRILTNPWVGNFPAFWMMPESQPLGWPKDGEIDIFESIDGENRAWHTIHSNWTWNLGNKNNPKSSYDEYVNLDRYHTYGLEWNETELIWYVDGKEVGHYDKSTNQSTLNEGQWPFNHHFHLILNQSVGNGSWAKNPDLTHTYETLFDWVRVYQKEGMTNTNGTVGIEYVDVVNGVEVNAFDGGVRISVAQPQKVSLFDVSGRKLFDAVVDDAITLSLQRGFYLVNGSKVFVK